MSRKLATIRTITAARPIEGADRIEQYEIGGGWLCVDSKGKYCVGDSVVYIEADAWCPHELAPFLSKGKEPRVYNGVPGEKLRTIRLKGAISQGLMLPLSALNVEQLVADLDYSDELGIQLWEPPPPMSADAKGPFPAFLVKTDQERAQNCYNDLTTLPADTTFEVTEKLDGQSYTAYLNNGEFGICSRNLELKLDQDSVWLQTARRYQIEEKLRDLGRNIAIQGEQVGPGIQGNPYKLPHVQLRIFNVYDIDAHRYLTPVEAQHFRARHALEYVPLVQYALPLLWVLDVGVSGVLKEADRQSAMPTAACAAEGLVFKANQRLPNGHLYSFKAISNDFLAKQK
jgi:RNA ligase (TIGR02306 family)